MNWEALDLTIIGPAFLAGLLVTSTHVPLGRRVLQRGIIFLDLAVAQIAGLGIIAAYSFEWEPGVLLLNFTEKRWPDIQEALIGTSFVLASSGSILLLATNPHGGEQLKELLVGQILWVNYEQIIPVLILYIAVLGLWFGVAHRASSLHFYLLFALAITASVQLVGVYLVFASLILPALAVRNVGKYELGYGYLIGGLGYLIGLVSAAILDMPAGAMIVYTLAITAIIIGLILSKYVKQNS